MDTKFRTIHTMPESRAQLHNIAPRTCLKYSVSVTLSLYVAHIHITEMIASDVTATFRQRAPLHALADMRLTVLSCVYNRVNAFQHASCIRLQCSEASAMHCAEHPASCGSGGLC